MESADSLDCHDSAVMDHFSCGNDRSSSPFFPSGQIYFRTACVATYRLCIITSGRRILILRSTVRTHREFLHAGPFSVIWKRIQDRKSGTAAGAVDKWVQITPVFRIVHFFLAFFADCNIRRDENLPFCLLTFYDLKIIEFPVFFLFYIFCIDLQYGSSLRRLLFQSLQKIFYTFFLSLCKDFHIGTFVTHTSGDSGSRCMTAHSRSEADALHNSVDTDFLCYHPFLPPCLKYIGSPYILLTR